MFNSTRTMTTDKLTNDTDTRTPRTRRRAAVALGGVLLAGGLVTSTALPASAVELDHDRPKITENDRDFGLNWTLGAPRNGGHLSWDLTNGITRPHTTGYLYLNNSANECAKIDVQHYNSSHTLLVTDSSPVHCAPNNNSKVQFWIDEDDQASSSVTHVHVRIMNQNSNGSFSLVGEDIHDFD